MIDEEKEELKREAFKARAAYEAHPTKDFRLTHLAAHFRLRDYEETAKHASVSASDEPTP